MTAKIAAHADVRRMSSFCFDPGLVRIEGAGQQVAQGVEPRR